MFQTPPLLSPSQAVLWLKVALSVATLGYLYARYRKSKRAVPAPSPPSARAKLLAALVVVVSLFVFHDLGALRGGSFVHHGEMFHYYMGSKYFSELGYYELYNAVLVADTEQGNTLAGLPFYTDLSTYQNAPREAATRDAERVKGLFSEARWQAFKSDVAFFKRATATAQTPGLFFLLMDHGYNGSPVSTFVLGLLSNAVPVTQLGSLALLDVLIVGLLIALVFHRFGLEIGALFSVYFSVNILNDHAYISGSLLRYDWLLYIVIAVCLLERRRHAWAGAFLGLSAMLRVFPALLFYGVAVVLLRKAKAAGRLDRPTVRFVVSTGLTALVLFVLPAASLGSVVRPWQEFSTKAALHDDGVYVNHLGLRGIALFEPSHLSLERFAAAYADPARPDIVRNWQDAKEQELQRKRPLLALAAFAVLLCVTAILWRTGASEGDGALWSLWLVYAFSFPSHYYYAFLCLPVLLFLKGARSLRGFVPLCLLWGLNVCVLVLDAFGPSPIVFYTWVNIGLFVGTAAILAFELYAGVFGGRSARGQDDRPQPESSGDAKRSRRRGRARRR